MNRARRNSAAVIILPAIIVTAAVIRIAFLVKLSNIELGEILPLDMRFYYDLASSMSSGGGLPQSGLTFNPLYPVFLAFVFKLFGTGLLVPRIIQCLAGLLTIWLIFHSARILAVGLDGDSGSASLDGDSGSASPDGCSGSTSPDGCSRAGDIAGITAASLALLYPQLLLYEGSLLATSLVTLVMAASFYTALAISRTLSGGHETKLAGRKVPLPATAVFLGILTGAGIMGRPNIFLFVAPLLTGWLYIASGQESRRWRLPALYAAAVIVMLLPASIYNASRTGVPAPVTAHGGINLYIGNMRGADGLYHPPEGMRRDMRGLIEDSRLVAEMAAGRKMTDAEVSAYWSGRARERIVTDPGSWLALLGRKFLLFWNGGELGDIVDIELMRREAAVFRLLIVRFALISTLAFAGIFLIVRYSSGRWPFLIFLAASMAAVVLFYFNTRYRLPSIPVLAASAGYFTAWTAGRITAGRITAGRITAGRTASGRAKAGRITAGRTMAGRWKELTVIVLALVLFFAAVSGREMFKVNRSATYTFLGNHYISTGSEKKALAAFGEALRLDPEGIENRINYARVLSRSGDREGARKYYALAWETDPDYPRLALEYGYLLEELGMRANAGTLYNHAWNSGRRSEMITAAKLLSRISYADGDVGAAVTWIRKALELVPGDEDLLKLLQRLEGQ